MKTKLAVWLVLVLMVTLGFGCLLPADGAITGGGFLENCQGDKVTFGFTVKGTQVGDCGNDEYDVKGQFQLVDHAEGLIIHGTFDGFSALSQKAWGECTVKGSECLEGPYDFTLYALDAGEPGMNDYIKVCIEIPGPDLKFKGTLDGGNIQVRGDLVNFL
jgi:hypothetical protein